MRLLVLSVLAISAPSCYGNGYIDMSVKLATETETI